MPGAHPPADTGEAPRRTAAGKSAAAGGSWPNGYPTAFLCLKPKKANPFAPAAHFYAFERPPQSVHSATFPAPRGWRSVLRSWTPQGDGWKDRPGELVCAHSQVEGINLGPDCSRKQTGESAGRWLGLQTHGAPGGRAQRRRSVIFPEEVQDRIEEPLSRKPAQTSSIPSLPRELLRFNTVAASRERRGP